MRIVRRLAPMLAVSIERGVAEPAGQSLPCVTSPACFPRAGYAVYDLLRVHLFDRENTTRERGKCLVLTDDCPPEQTFQFYLHVCKLAAQRHATHTSCGMHLRVRAERALQPFCFCRRLHARWQSASCQRKVKQARASSVATIRHCTRSRAAVACRCQLILLGVQF